MYFYTNDNLAGLRSYWYFKVECGSYSGFVEDALRTFLRLQLFIIIIIIIIITNNNNNYYYYYGSTPLYAEFWHYYYYYY